MTVEQMQAARTTTQADVDRITREHDQRYLIGDFAGLRFEEDDSPTVHLHPWGRTS